jgi:hypothetical protein
MMKKVVLILSFIFSLTNANSQKGIIKGRLVDYHTEKPIIEVPVILYGTTLGCRSNNEGVFEFTKLKLTTTELIVHGQPVVIMGTGEQSATENSYFSLILRNIELTKKNKVVDLGNLYMVNLEYEKLFDELPCAKLGDNQYSYQLIDGSETLLF